MTSKAGGKPTILQGALLPALLVALQLLVAPSPFQHRARLHTVGRAGEIFVYKHPQPVIEVTFEVDPAAKVICVWNVAAPRIKVEQTIFISYSHEDEEWLLKLKKFLSDLEEQDLIRFWDDKEIQARPTV